MMQPTIIPSLKDSIDRHPAQQFVEHKGIKCNGCNITPIIGIRYKCVICKDFDYCSSCENECVHDHPMLKIRKHGQCPSVIIVAMDEEE